MLLAPLLLCGCLGPAAQHGGATTGATRPPHDSPRATPASAWLRTELYFGTGPADAPQQGVSEAQWRGFLDREVTPRFRGGFSVLDLYGQWQGPTQKVPERLRSKLIVLLHQDSPQTREDIEAIRAAWQRQTGDESVLRVTQPAEVAF